MSDDDQVLKALDSATGTPGKGRRLLSAGFATAAVPLLAYAGHKGYQHLKNKKEERAKEIEKQAQYDVLRAYGLEKAAGIMDWLKSKASPPPSPSHPQWEAPNEGSIPEIDLSEEQMQTMTPAAARHLLGSPVNFKPGVYERLEELSSKQASYDVLKTYGFIPEGDFLEFDL